jgi:hypothetical protein
VGISLGALFFYDFPFSETIGFRNMIDKLHWSFFKKEAILVMLWSACLSVAVFRPSTIKQLFLLRSNKRKALLLLLIQILLIVIPTSLAVFAFIKRFPSEASADARGIPAGVLLRIGLTMSLLISWTKWPTTSHSK